jgi:hypothetical protein
MPSRQSTAVRRNAPLLLVVATVLAIVLSVSSLVISLTNMVKTNSVTGSSHTKSPYVVSIPTGSKEVNTGVFYLGEKNYQNKNLKGYMFTHDMINPTSNSTGNNSTSKKHNNHSHSHRNRKSNSNVGGSGGSITTTGEGNHLGPSGASCYELFATGSKWKETETYFVDTTNAQGLTGSFVLGRISSAIGAWNALTIPTFVIGTRDSSSSGDGPDPSTPDGKNEWSFGSISNEGTIAVAIVWGIFDGPVEERELVEWDVVFDEDDYEWGDSTANPSKMDLQNIATHEFGHCVGLADLYTEECSGATMYGYASEGETKKRSLDSGDINGFCSLYECTGSTGTSGDDDTGTGDSGTLLGNNNLNLSIIIIMIIFFVV